MDQYKNTYHQKIILFRLGIDLDKVNSYKSLNQVHMQAHKYQERDDKHHSLAQTILAVRIGIDKNWDHYRLTLIHHLHRSEDILYINIHHQELH
jgi:hypothetical protein